VIPFPEYPILQEQVKLPSVFVHVATPDAQLLVPLVHSLISMNFFIWLFYYFSEREKETVNTNTNQAIPRISSFANANKTSNCI